jgi:hypothetical protein
LKPVQITLMVTLLLSNKRTPKQHSLMPPV